MYIGNNLQVANPSYKIIDDISSSFNGSTTSFALQVNGATPVPFPISTQQVMISVNGVVQEPDPSGSEGFKLLGSNIVFSSAPANGQAFFGVINAGADYVTAGSEFPDGSATAPSFTFQDDQDTGWFRSGSGAVGYSANGVQTLTFDGNGLTVTGDATFTGDSSKNLFWDKSDGQLEFADNSKAMFGAGNDLEIYSTGTNGWVFTPQTGADLYVGANAGEVYIQTGASGNDTGIKVVSDGAVELYHDNVKTFATEDNGIFVYGPEGGVAQILLYADEGDDGPDKWRIQSDTSGNFKVGNFSTGSWVDSLVIDDEGKVGIGTASVNKNSHSFFNIHRATSDASYMYFTNTTTGETGSDGFTLGLDGDENALVWNRENTNLRFGTNSTERMRISSTGRLLVGTTDDSGYSNRSAYFHVGTATNSWNYVSITGGTSEGAGIVFGDSTGQSGANYESYLSHDNTSNYFYLIVGQESHRFTFTNTGRLGIGPNAFVAPQARLHIKDAGQQNLIIGSSDAGGAYLVLDGDSDGDSTGGDYAYIGHDTNGDLLLAVDNPAGNGNIFLKSNGASYQAVGCYESGIVQLRYQNTTKLETSSTGITVTGAVSDSKGDLRLIPENVKTSAYTLIASDEGKHINISSGGVTVPNAVFREGSAVTIVNTSGSDQTITQGSSFTLYNTADASTGNRTLAGRGMCTILFCSASIGYISGAGLS